MAAQGSEPVGTEKRTVTCERCFALIPADEAVCPECGAQLVVGEGLSSVEDALHADLARANLLRMRGDYDAARTLCLSILKRFPNSDAGHTLMGDICADEKQWSQAVEWYELALDLSPDSAADKQKLEDARRQITSKQDEDTVAQLGLPPATPRVPIIAVGIVIAILLFASVAYFMNSSRRPHAGGGAPSSQTIQATPDGSSSEPAVAPTATTPKALAGEPQEDRTAFQALVRASTESARIVSVVRDPRGGLLTVTFTYREGDDERTLAAKIAKDALDVTDGQMVTLRGVKGEHIAYMADVYRSKLGEEGAGTTGSEAWVDSILSHEWPAHAAVTPAGPASPTASPSSTEGTPPPATSTPSPSTTLPNEPAPPATNG